MAPIVTMILSKILDYLADHADEIVAAIREKFQSAREDPEVKGALLDFGFQPDAENLAKLHDALEAKGEDTKELAKIVVNNAQV